MGWDAYILKLMCHSIQRKMAIFVFVLLMGLVLLYFSILISGEERREEEETGVERKEEKGGRDGKPYSHDNQTTKYFGSV